jgi:predicted Zn-dependent protease
VRILGRIGLMVLILILSLVWYAGRQVGTAWSNQSSVLCSLTIVPIGDFPAQLVMENAQQVRRTFGTQVRIERPIPIAEDAIDHGRQQLVAERLIASMKAHLTAQTKDPSVMLVGLTQGDMYLQGMDWEFAFAGREAGRFAVISTARMDPESFGLPKDERTLTRRLKKMVLKQVGLYFYGLPERSEPTSVLFSPILGIDDLDAVSPDIDATDRARLAHVKKSCHS